MVYNLGETGSIFNNFISEIRNVDVQGDPLRFRRNLERIGEVMAYEISKKLSLNTIEVKTPLGNSCVNIPNDSIVLATVLRAGLPFHQGFLNYFDRAENCFVSAYRKFKTQTDFEIVVGYISSPSLDDKVVILSDPMLASGASMELAYKAILEKGTPKHVHIASVIASQQGVDYLKQHVPEDKVTIWCGAIDPELNDHAYIVPGLGDAGDLAYGEKL